MVWWNEGKQDEQVVGHGGNKGCYKMGTIYCWFSRVRKVQDLGWGLDWEGDHGTKHGIDTLPTLASLRPEETIPHGCYEWWFQNETIRSKSDYHWRRARKYGKNITSESMNQRCVIVRCGHWERKTGSVCHPGSLSTSSIPIRLGLTGVRKKLQK